MTTPKAPVTRERRELTDGEQAALDATKNWARGIAAPIQTMTPTKPITRDTFTNRLLARRPMIDPFYDALAELGKLQASCTGDAGKPQVRP